MAQKYLIPTQIDLAALLLRIGSSIFMIGHGWEKLQTILSGTWVFPDPIGLGGPTSLFLTVFAEFFCSIALILGFLTRPASFFLAFTMAVAGFIIHRTDPWSEKEHSLLYFVMYVAIFLMGPGKFSFDHKMVSKYLKF